MKVYKLTSSSGLTRGPTQWGPGVTHRALGRISNGSRKRSLCTDAYIHWYSDIHVGLLLDPSHAKYTCTFDTFQVWEAETGGKILDDYGLKGGSRKLTTVRELPPEEIPSYTDIQRVAFAILCAKEVEANPVWNQWADGWLSGEDRSLATAERSSRISEMWTVMRASWAAKTLGGGYRIFEEASSCACAAVAEAILQKRSLDLPALAKKAMEF